MKNLILVFTLMTSVSWAVAETNNIQEMADSIWVSQFDLQFGFQHESNGRDSMYGRTWDRLYAQPFWTFGETLRLYNEETTTYRLGFSLSR